MNSIKSAIKVDLLKNVIKRKIVHIEEEFKFRTQEIISSLMNHIICNSISEISNFKITPKAGYDFIYKNKKIELKTSDINSTKPNITKWWSNKNAFKVPLHILIKYDITNLEDIKLCVLVIDLDEYKKDIFWGNNSVAKSSWSLAIPSKYSINAFVNKHCLIGTLKASQKWCKPICL